MDEPRFGPGAIPDTVVGVFTREDLSAALAATHRAGFGPHARVFDENRGDLAGQLCRAGLDLPPIGDGLSTALIVVTAPGRGAVVAELLKRAGARAVHAAARMRHQPSAAEAVHSPGSPLAPPAAEPTDAPIP